MDFEPYEIESTCIDDGFSFSLSGDEDLKDSIQQARAIKARHRLTMRRAFSEIALQDILPDQIAPGDSWHVISGGDVDSLSYIAHIVEREPLDYLLFSTWCMNGEDVARFGKWVDEGKIGRLDAYVGEIFPNQYADAFQMLTVIARRAGGRVCVFRNHAKIYAGHNDRLAFAIESSANINTNPRTEQTAIHASPELFTFYKEYFDAIKCYQRDFEHWTPYEIRPRSETDRPQAD